MEYGIFEHTPESIEEWAPSLQKKFNNQPVAICLELKSGTLVYALLKYNFIVLFPIHPIHPIIQISGSQWSKG